MTTTTPMDNAMAKANAILDNIDFLDPVKPAKDFHECITNTERRRIGNLINTVDSGNLTTKETLAIALGAMRFAFGQWPDNDDKHDMSEAASEFATEIISMVSGLKKEEPLFDALKFAELMDEKEIDTE